MSENLQSPTSDPPSARGIILVEQYGSLGIAIAAALKKFAPLYALRVVQALDEAEAAAEPMQPQLFILDLDPPPSGQVEFLDRLRRHYPEARVLVLAAGTSRELLATRGTSGALQFIEKPFELAEFGAAVQALVGPLGSSPATEFRGTLRDLHLLDIAQLQCLAYRATMVRLETPTGKKGEVYFRNGEVWHAAIGTLTGLPALEEMMRWQVGKFSESDASDVVTRTINQPWGSLLLELSRKTESLPAKVVEPTPPPVSTPQRTGKKILVIDDTEMLLIFAADVLASVDPTYQVTTALTGGEGLKLAAALRPDLVLLDYSLTDMNGDEVCRGLLSDETTARIPVLLMSGHLPEMTRTAETCNNVVFTLAKPFLSGALIDAVENILTRVGPADAPVPSPVPQVDEPISPPVPSSPSPNGHGTGNNGGFIVSPPLDFSTPPASALLLAPNEVAGAFPARQMESAFSSGVATQTREVTLTMACEVISVQLAPDFRMGALQLKPAEATVIVQMNGATSFSPEKDFLLGPISLTAAGKIDHVRIIPTARSPHLEPSEGDFAVDRVSTPATAEGRLVELTGATGAAMRVQLIAEFELLTVDLSETFEVAVAVLQSQSNSVRVQTGNSGAVAMQFFIHDVQVDESHLLTGLNVGSRN